MRVMGVDPGLTRCGLALIETAPGRAVTALDVDVVRTSADEPLERRLRAVHEVADEWMAVH
ncbi:MAG: crossover junction endodeoxyribonuclease RuvC, partial [Dietzia cercidiphylli]